MLARPAPEELTEWYAGQPFVGTRSLKDSEREALLVYRRKFGIFAAVVLVCALLIVVRSWLGGSFWLGVFITSLVAIPTAIFVRPFYLVNRGLKEGEVLIFGPGRERRDDGAAEAIRDALKLKSSNIGPIVVSSRGDLLLAGGKANPSIIQRKFGRRMFVARPAKFSEFRRNLTVAEKWELQGKLRIMTWSLLAITAPLLAFAWIGLMYAIGRMDINDYLMLVVAIAGFCTLIVPVLRIGCRLPSLVRDHSQGEVLREGDEEYLPNSRAVWSRDGEPTTWRTSSGGGNLWSLVAETREATD